VFRNKLPAGHVEILTRPAPKENADGEQFASAWRIRQSVCM